ncbi:MAG: hypothetical protein LGB53_06905 [Sulfurovum sp.]|nr:hypothetical protein [Sulfurovum sp.]
MNLKKSLKSIKRSINNQNKIFTTIKRLYTHLSELSNEEILDYYNVNSLKELENHIEHIKKVLKERLENYEEELNKITGCFCTDSCGDFKYLYPTKKEATQQLNYSWQTKRVKLLVYACPYHCGWHLRRG